MNELLVTGPAAAEATLVLAHGAGAPMDSPFMNAIATGLAAEGVRVVRFEFPYMARRRQGGSGRAPDKEAVLRACFGRVLDQLGGGAQVAIGGKSLGGRMASLIADEVGARALVCLGYPFHPVGQPQKTRTAHLATLKTQTLIVQGTRDGFGRPEEVSGYSLSPAIRLAWLEDGDHSFVPRVRSGFSEAGHLAQAVSWIRDFLREAVVS